MPEYSISAGQFLNAYVIKSNISLPQIPVTVLYPKCHALAHHVLSQLYPCVCVNIVLPFVILLTLTHTKFLSPSDAMSSCQHIVAVEE